ncbi:MAG: PaaI family thioesterase, partial [Gemmatimonadales bacterium]
RPEPAHAQEYGVVHGGIVSTLADTAAVYTILPGLAAGERMTSIEFKVNFLAGAVVERGEVTARARMVRKGRTVAVVLVDVQQGEVQVATGLFTYIILRSAG